MPLFLMFTLSLWFVYNLQQIERESFIWSSLWLLIFTVYFRGFSIHLVGWGTPGSMSGRALTTEDPLWRCQSHHSTGTRRPINWEVKEEKPKVKQNSFSTLQATIMWNKELQLDFPSINHSVLWNQELKYTLSIIHSVENPAHSDAQSNTLISLNILIQGKHVSIPSYWWK